MFYFTSFYGDKTSLLHYFYLAAYKVIFNDAGYIQANDEFRYRLPITKHCFGYRILLRLFTGSSA